MSTMEFSSSIKRKATDSIDSGDIAIEDDDAETKTSASLFNEAVTASGDTASSSKKPSMTKAREVRLEQNRKAARESRRRKKLMVEELQRSVIIFSRTNGTLKQQNEELQRLLLQAQAQVIAMESSQHSNSRARSSDPSIGKSDKESVNSDSAGPQVPSVSPPLTLAQVHAQHLASYAQQQATAQALYESQGLSSTVARSAVKSLLSSPPPASSASVINRGADVPAPMNASGLNPALNMLPQWSSMFPGMMGSSIPVNSNPTNPQMLQEALSALYAASLPQLNNMMSSNSNVFQQHAELLQQLSRGSTRDDSSVTTSPQSQYRSL